MSGQDIRVSTYSPASSWRYPEFQVHRGELFGFLGPNGALKTTTINMLIGLAPPEAGAPSPPIAHSTLASE
ncbi:MAG: ATP-binding cassette domain-containing protein [Deltaproteobacteria bacterium]|nr:MAG: ATP-binding cassette domain-containing protein [Deltaproteobacteria bacterium]RPJ13963.1 MAG: ATP-binding cassette domain-containing protein [Deltaproteobacteria bacterium]